MKLYHVSTPKKAKRYRDSGCIIKPVRGFDTLEGAMAWAIKTGRTVIYEVEGDPAYKLPDLFSKIETFGYGEERLDEMIEAAEAVTCRLRELKEFRGLDLVKEETGA